MRAPSMVFGVAIALFAALPEHAHGQNEDLFAKMRVDVSIVVYKHRTGADMVTITVLSPAYSRADLFARATEIGNELGTPDRGLNVFYEGNGSEATGSSPFLKATFATNGILNGPAGVRLQALVKPFAGGVGNDLVQGLDIHLQGVQPTNTTLSTFSSPAVQVEGRPEAGQPSIEYRVLLKTQDPTLIVVPDRREPAGEAGPSQSPPPAASSTVIWLLVIVGALAAGALVYNLALRGQGRTHRG
ncbi:MAG: hypothetical protein ACYC96_07640 [Fimbriimonadaceae bacterium]